MEKRKDPVIIEDEKEKKAIAWENNILLYLMPSVGLVAFLFGLIGFILVVPNNTGVAIFLILLAALGLGGVTYGVVEFLKRRNRRRVKQAEEAEDK